jgi:hypothetical protein
MMAPGKDGETKRSLPKIRLSTDCEANFSSWDIGRFAQRPTVHQSQFHTRIDQFKTGLWNLFAANVPIVNQHNKTNGVLAEYHDQAVNGPPSTLKRGLKLLGQRSAFRVARDTVNRNPLSGEWLQDSDEFGGLCWRELPPGRLSFCLTGIFLGVSQLFAHCGAFLRMPVISLLLLVSPLLISGSLASSDQLVFAQAVDMRHDFAGSEQEEAADTKPKVEMTPPSSAFGRIPSGQPSHDSYFPFLLGVALSFLFGFRLR